MDNQRSAEPQPLRLKSESLRGKTILVTRARDQSEDITTHLESMGATVVHFPTIEFIPPTSWEPLDSAIARISAYDWLVFTSSNAARYFFSRLNTNKDAKVAVANMTICAIGPGTANAVTAAGARVDVIASDSFGEGAVNAIVAASGGHQRVRHLKFLIPRARIAREVLPDALRELGARVDVVEAYQTVKPDVDAGPLIHLLTERRIDAVTFTSSSTISNFAQLLGVSDLSDLLSGMVVACIGPITAKTAARYGLTTVIQPEKYDVSSMVELLISVLSTDKAEH